MEGNGGYLLSGTGMIMNSFGSLNYWIGASDQDSSRGWQWTDGTPFEYFNWNDGIMYSIF